MKELFLPSALLQAVSLLIVFGQAANAEVPFDPPGTYSSSWLGNTYMDAKGHKNVTEELADMTAHKFLPMDLYKLNWTKKQRP